MLLRKWRERRRVLTAGPDKDVGGDIVDAVFRQPEDPSSAWSHFLRLLSYELWLTSGELESPPSEEDLPPSYVMAMRRWPDAFEYVRHSMFMYVGRALGHAPWGTVLLSLLKRIVHQSQDPGVLQRALRTGYERFLRQYREAWASVRLAAGHDDPEPRLRTMLAGWVAIYETDFPLWLLGTLANALQTGTVDPSYLGGPDTKTAQAALLETVQENLIGTPFESTLEQAYIPSLRNALVHNDYEFLDSPEGLRLRETKTGREWSEDELWSIVTSGQELLQSVLLAAQVLMATLLDDSRAWVDYGITSMSYGVTSERLALVIVTQLWCFRDLDPEGRWLDRAVIHISEVGDGQEQVSLTPNAHVSGVAISRQPFGEALSQYGWAWVVRIPVAPAIGLGLPNFKNVEGELLEVVGPSDAHLVPASRP